MAKKQSIVKWAPNFSDKAYEFTQPDFMVKMLATIDPKGRPHITFINNNRAISKDKLVWGQFFTGTSKTNVLDRPKTGVLYMTPDKPFRILQAKAEFTHTKTAGEELDYFNNSKLMRYFTYLNIYKVYYSDVIAVSSVRTIPLGGIVKGVLKNLIGKGGAKTKLPEKKLNSVGFKIFKGPVNPKYIAYIDPADGYPIIIPCIQLTATDKNRLVFPPSVLKADLEGIPVDTKVAVYGVNWDLASQLVKGTFTGYEKFRGIRLGIIEIEEIYSGSPPLCGVYYPKLETRPKITDFHL